MRCFFFYTLYVYIHTAQRMWTQVSQNTSEYGLSGRIEIRPHPSWVRSHLYLDVIGSPRTDVNTRSEQGLKVPGTLGGNAAKVIFSLLRAGGVMLYCRRSQLLICLRHMISIITEDNSLRQTGTCSPH